MQKKSVAKLVVAAMCLALALVLPFLTGQIREIGSMLCPMHLPVLLCGFLCGWPWGLAVGVVAPLLRSVLFGMPPMFPIAVSMAVELAVYGFLTGFVSAKLPRKIGWLYVAACAACAGRPLRRLVHDGDVPRRRVYDGHPGHHRAADPRARACRRGSQDKSNLKSLFRWFRQTRRLLSGGF